MKPINVGLLGIGTVGGGTWDVVRRNADEIQRRAGRAIKITQVADKALHRAKKITAKKAKVVGDAFTLVRDAQIDIVVELIGGYSIARELVLEAIRNGKHVVTANKALLATHGTEIFAAAQKNGVMVAFEGSVGGGIPIIKALREGLAANRIEWIAGIINGTSNFILSEMRDRGLDFSAALGEAQRRGYAEADPSFDVEGGDAAGSQPTASAVVADLIDVTRLITADPEHRVPHLAFQPDQLADTPILPIGEVETSCYLRMRVLDRPGVLADITRILADSKISIGAMVQKEPGQGESRVDIVMLTHRALEKNVNQAMAKIEKLSTVVGKVTRIRLEELL